MSASQERNKPIYQDGQINNEIVDMVSKMYGMINEAQDRNKKLIKLCEDFSRLAFRAINSVPNIHPEVHTKRRELVVLDATLSKIKKGDTDHHNTGSNT